MSVPTRFYLFKRANGFWYVLYNTDRGKRWKSTRATRKVEAVNFLRAFQESEQKKNRTPANTLLSAFMDDYLSYSLATHRPKTHESAATALRELLRIIGDLPMRLVGVREIEQFVSAKTAEASMQTAKTYFVTLASAFETAKRWEYIERNPFRQIQKPRPPESQPLHFSHAEFFALMERTVIGDDRELYLCALLTGMRLSELTALQWTDIDLKEKLIHVRNSEFFTTKTKKNRVVPMSDQLCELLTARRTRAACEVVFHLNCRQLKKDCVSKRFKACVRRAGLRDGLHFHSLRHTFATWLVQAGVSIYEVQRLLGHSSIAMTQVYAHLAPSELDGTVEKILPLLEYS